MILEREFRMMDANGRVGSSEWPLGREGWISTGHLSRRSLKYGIYRDDISNVTEVAIGE